MAISETSTANTQKAESEIGYSYVTIKVTRSRLDKGLLAIPVSLLDKFPKEKRKITLFFDDEDKSYMKSFSPYDSSSKECRINGLASWFIKNGIQDKDEIVIQVLDDMEGIYRLVKESMFIEQVKVLEEKILNATEEHDVERHFGDLSLKVNHPKQEVAIVEFLKLNREEMRRRIYKKPIISIVRENVPASLRKILEIVYKGKCQISNFTFTQRNGKSYFEIHHIKPDWGNHLKNLLVVSPNIHAMFTYASCEEYFDNEGWLRTVKFNNEVFNVYQAIDTIKNRRFVKDIHS
jgi:predicted restriction endonuclease